MYGKYYLYSYILFMILNAEDVQNTKEQWLLNLLVNRIIYANCAHKAYWQGLFSSLLASETIFTNPTSNRRLKISPNRSLEVNKNILLIRNQQCMLMYLFFIPSSTVIQEPSNNEKQTHQVWYKNCPAL